MKWYQLISIVVEGNQSTVWVEFVYSSSTERVLKKRYEDDLADEYPAATIRRVEVTDLRAELQERGVAISF